MTSTPSQEINDRVFLAIEDLKSKKEISGLSGFCEENGFNRKRYIAIKNKKDKTVKDYKNIEVDFIYILSKKHHVSLNWIFHGIGNMYKKLPKNLNTFLNTNQ